VRSAADFARRINQLREAGLGAQDAFRLLNTFSQGSVTHLLRANFEDGRWVRDRDAVLAGIVADLAKEEILEDDQVFQTFLRLGDGGLGLGSAEAAVAAAYLGSWALTLHHITETMGVTSYEGFRTRCTLVTDSIDRAETRLREQGGGQVEPIDWLDYVRRSREKMQGAWSRKAREKDRDKFLSTLSTDERVDFRSNGGPGAGGFLEPPVVRDDMKAASMPDAHFEVMLRDRMRLPVCPAGSRCQHRSKQGVLCNEPLDPRGKHPLKCEVGGGLTRRHDPLRDFTAKFHQQITGLGAITEQRVMAWDRIHPTTGVLQEARLDVATRDAVTGRSIFVDTTVTCAHSGNEPRQRARSNKDGLAAAHAVDEKHSRYPPTGGELVPLAFETGGRPAEETVAFVRAWGHGLPAGEDSEVIRYAWQQFSTLLQNGNAELILSAVG
jgi:hypothetical protein